MSVENVKVEYIRKKGYKNLKEWINDENNIYIGRAGVVFIEKQRYPKESSIFCNPYKIGKDGNRENVIKMYKNYILSKIDNSEEFKNKLLQLKGKNLGCWCYPEACHGDILLDIINQY